MSSKQAYDGVTQAHHLDIQSKEFCLPALE